MTILYYIVAAVLGAVVALGCYIAVRKIMLKGQKDEILEKALLEAEKIKQEKIFQAKEKFLQLKSEHEQYINEKNSQIHETENRLRQKENSLNQQNSELGRKQKENDAIRENLKKQVEIVTKKSEEYDRLRAQAIEQIENIAGMSAAEAKNQLMENMKAEARSQAQSYINDVMDEARLTAGKEAKRIVINTIQRTASETAIENAVTVFILLSAFDPVRRVVARLALHQLVVDGRIHPARIEEVVAKVQKQLEDEIMETGKRTCIDLGIHGMHIELVKLIGRMKYRSSYGQNLLQHSREVANICATMASELGLNPKVAKRAGLLHDIGKVSDEDPELPHAILGMKLAEKYKEKPEVCNAIGAHHEEIDMTSIISPLVMVGDAISGARPGARREVIESYIKRLQDMENIAKSYPGVTKTYAIQAGRELRVIVGADQVSDKDAEALSGDIAKKIQEEMVYPGQVKITVIRETRSVAYAK